MQGISPHSHPLVFPASTHTCSQFTCCSTCSFKKQWMAEQCHGQSYYSNIFQVDCHSLIISLRLKTANLHSVKVKIQPKYTKFGNYTNTAWSYWSPRMYMSGNGGCNYSKYMYPPQWSLDLCAGPSGGRDKHFFTYFVPLSVWKLNLSVVFLTYKKIKPGIFCQPY